MNSVTYTCIQVIGDMVNCKYCSSASNCTLCTSLYLYSNNLGCFSNCASDPGYL